jgi:hypothetical protein
MSKPSFTLSILVTTLTFISVQAQTADAKAGTATISGRVTLKGEPARNVVIALQSEDAARIGDRSPGLRAKTDENGLFRLSGVKAGRYVLGALAPGFVVPGDSVFGLQGKAINISEGENLENLDLTLKQGGVITGRVTDSNDRPLVEQQVELIRLDERGQPVRAAPVTNPFMYSTDDRGIYRIYGLPAGRYLVSAGFAQREGSLMLTVNRTYYQRTFHPDTIDQSRAKVIEVSEGFEATDVDIKAAELKKTYDVFGCVVNADTGLPVPGLRVSFGALAEGGKRVGSWGMFDNRTDAQGNFHIPGVLPGKYAAFAARERDGDVYSEAVVFEISDSDVTGLVVNVRRGSSMSGVAVIEGANDPAILSKLPQMQLYASVRSDELSPPESSTANLRPDGSFVIRGLKPGVARLSLSYKPDLGKFSILRIEHHSAPQGGDIQINASEQVTGVRVVIGHGMQIIRGQLRITGGSLPEDAGLFISAYRAGTEIRNGTGGQVDARGQFVVEGLTPGEYELKLSVFFRFGATPEKSRLAERLGKMAQPVTVGNSLETQVTFNVDLTQKGGEQ